MLLQSIRWNFVILPTPATFCCNDNSRSRSFHCCNKSENDDGFGATSNGNVSTHHPNARQPARLVLRIRRLLQAFCCLPNAMPFPRAPLATPPGTHVIQEGGNISVLIPCNRFLTRCFTRFCFKRVCIS